MGRNLLTTKPKCFICEKKMTLTPPYVELAKGKFAHFICFQNARTKLVNGD